MAAFCTGLPVIKLTAPHYVII